MSEVLPFVPPPAVCREKIDRTVSLYFSMLDHPGFVPTAEHIASMVSRVPELLGSSTCCAALEMIGDPSGSNMGLDVCEPMIPYAQELLSARAAKVATVESILPPTT